MGKNIHNCALCYLAWDRGDSGGKKRHGLRCMGFVEEENRGGFFVVRGKAGD